VSNADALFACDVTDPNWLLIARASGTKNMVRWTTGEGVATDANYIAPCTRYGLCYYPIGFKRIIQLIFFISGLIELLASTTWVVVPTSPSACRWALWSTSSGLSPARVCATCW